MTGARALFVFTAIALAIGGSREARADEPTEGFHGRWDDGDLFFALGAGGGVTSPDVGPARALATLEVRARVIDMAGPMLAYRVAPDTTLEHALVVGVEVRPFFPALVLTGASTGHEWTDLLLESIGVELGAAFALNGEVRPGLAVGTAIELPLLLPSRSRTRLALRLAVRRIDARRAFRNVDPDVDRSAWDALATLSVSFAAKVGIAGRRRTLDR